MKKLKNLFKSNLPKSTTCGAHFEHILPNLRPLEYCNTCSSSICYTCGNNHFDKYCNVEWGLEVFDSIEGAKNEKNEKFNLGYPYLIDTQTLKCPCGTHFLSKPTSTICAACGTATCSAECHDKYAQRENKCLFIKNFTPNEETAKIQGLRLIKVTDFLNAIKLKLPVYTRTSLCNSKFMKALVSPEPFSYILQRGFRQYGQPHDSTLENMKEYTTGEAEKLFKNHSTKLCMCECDKCANRSPHPIFNCFVNCENAEKITEEEKLQLGLYRKCQCTCSFCLNCMNKKIFNFNFIINF
jgi:hypothetical protein